VNGLFDVSRLTPHGFCLAWQPGLIWLEAVSDLLIAGAYFSIPAALVVFLRRRPDLAFKRVFALFAGFILSCGLTHVMGAVTLWVPLYWLDGALKVMTAALSVATAIVLWPLIPKALALPSPARLREVNEALAREVELGEHTTAQLRASEARLRQLYARTPAALHAVDAEGTLLEVSDAFLDLVGYERDEVIGQPIAAFYTPGSAQDSVDHMAALRAGSMLRTASRRLICRDGRVRDLDVSLEVERDAGGRLQGVLAVATDVTTARETEAALQAAEERLHHAQKMEAVGQLTGGIAHDFNNLLTTIMGSLELLQQKSTLDERAVRLTSNALEGSRRAARLTSQLLSFSRRQRLSPEALMPGEIVDGIADLLGRTLGDRIALVVEDESDLAPQWPVLADRSQMEAALMNLVINARDAIEADGSVTISMGNRHVTAGRQGELTLTSGDYVSIAVTDTGAGMTEAVRDRAFEPFFTTKPQGAGTGLGLSQTYGFVTQSGGTVRLQSAPGRGTRVEMLLPRAHQAPQAPAAPTSDGRCASGEHILLVEDDALLRHAMAAALQARGFRVSQAEDGETAMRLLSQGGVSLLFTDVRMPGALSGVDLAVAARTRWPDLPVLLATGYADAPELEGWAKREDVLAKPYAVDDLVGRMLAMMRTHERA
jgi:PAS domain S-box-containing protein